MSSDGERLAAVVGGYSGALPMLMGAPAGKGARWALLVLSLLN